MAFDFAKAELEAKKDFASNKLGLVILGSSGNGKSFIMGTFGVKTLYLYTGGETHGPKSAKNMGKDNVVAVRIDQDGGQALSPDKAYARLLTIISDVESIKKAGFGAIVVDGLSEVETLIRGTAVFKSNTTKAFSEGPATLEMFRPLMDGLRTLQRELDVHYAVTCILNVKEYGPHGEILDATPNLHGYQVATGLIQQFPDILVIGRMEKSDKVAYRLQMLASASKDTKDFKTGEIRKTFNFSPRLTGVNTTELASTLDANLAEIAKLKAGK